MVPKIHAKGTSFKGAAAYLLHDKGQATTTERVAWVETVNLSTRRPDSAWRVMAATAIDAARLKEQAGVKKTGRNSRDAVLHVSLSWSPDQAPDRVEMTKFAHRALKALKAEDRQAMIICHSDERHAHVHLLVNRVSPKDGRLLSSSNEKMALSALALAYEKEAGEILCVKRQENAERRERGEYTRGEKDMPRADFEAMRGAQNDAEQKVPERLIQARPGIIAALRRETRATFRARLSELRQSFSDQWAALYVKQRGDSSAVGQGKIASAARTPANIAERTAEPNVSLPFLHSATNSKWLMIGTQKQQQSHMRSEMAGQQRGRLSQMVYAFKQECGLKLARLILQYDNRVAAPDDPRAKERRQQLADDQRLLDSWRKNPPRYKSPNDREFEP